MNRILITGASDGIGRAMALAFARRGQSLGLIARREAQLREVRELCLGAGAPTVELAAVDATDSAAFRAALEGLERRLGPTDIFVANAGLGDSIEPAADGGPAARAMTQLNVTAAIDGLEWMKARMVARGRGRLVGMSSVAGARGLPGAAVYSATKAALTAYLEALRIELHRRGVRVTTIAPGFIATAANRARDRERPLPMLLDPQKAGEIFARQILRGRRTIVAPLPWVAVSWLLRHLPGPLYELARFFRRQ